MAEQTVIQELEADLARVRRQRDDYAAELARITGAGALHRLARHDYIRGCALEGEAARRWDNGEVPPDRVADYLRAAQLALVAIREGRRG
ncbi:hypothetical protein C1I95_24630 [Micromonospora craterilacus]|uniref:Uncharacterized protein n=1 Tax=Micromonospora craterilacus TaxID=1655439 RepID=A0A2W2EUG0_9ACTN|nr:hypothetical protein [Micromonospora craterilacus]PZG12997.1 hypothetical protein C1I95_24630 [Micromonospora craterilacus]